MKKRVRWGFGVGGASSINNGHGVTLNKVIRGRLHWEDDIWSKIRRRWGLEQCWMLKTGEIQT